MISQEPKRTEWDMGPVLDARSFARVSELAMKQAGLNIPDTKHSMVQSRLSKRLRATGLGAFSSYLDLVESPEGTSEMPEFISALTTNVSSFLRENHHFETLRKEICPQLLEKIKQGERIRIWSAGCSTGQEPYSIALTLLEESAAFASGDVRILATDIDLTVLNVGRLGKYDAKELASLNPSTVAKFFGSTETELGTQYEAGPELKNMIRFLKLNLIDPWPMRGKFDVIFCRNVLIYFSDEVQGKLWPRFHNSLNDGGWMLIGHSERIPNPGGVGFEPAGVTTYRKSAARNDIPFLE